MGLKKILIDIPALIDSGISAENIKCEYTYHRKNNGAFSLLELAEFAVYCRQCEDAFCVSACPKDALEHLESGVIKRWNMRCVGCKSCVLACPFGTIFPEVINYVSANCDFCMNQLEANTDYQPLCVKTAPLNTLRMVVMDEEDKKNHIYFCGENVAVKSPSWRMKEERV
ncbi:MAG: 4Fe-4S dicluster domain-containing protein [bacterium]